MNIKSIAILMSVYNEKRIIKEQIKAMSNHNLVHIKLFIRDDKRSARRCLLKKWHINSASVWINVKTMRLSGIVIEKVRNIVAGSVDTDDIPKYAIAAGNPVKMIKRYDFATSKWVCVHA